LNLLEQKIRNLACKKTQKVAIKSDTISLDYQNLLLEIETTCSNLGLSASSSNTSHPQYQQKSFAFIIDNHPAWAVLDLALLFKKQCAVPLPKFFSIEQLKHALEDSKVEFLILDESETNTQLVQALEAKIMSRESLYIAQKRLNFYHLKKPTRPSKFSKGDWLNPNELSAVKITYTSGTTDRPKGVVLSEDVIMSKVVSLASASEASENDISLAILPLSTLLENIAGLYVLLYCGATVTLLAPESIGLSGSSQVNQQQLFATIEKYQPTAFIIIPQLLLLLIKMISKGYQLPDSIRFIAMGGAPISRQLLDRAQQLKIPVFEGYGLSEAASVVAVNNPSNNRTGSVGKVLNTHQIQVKPDKEGNEGEILIKDHLFNGYLGQQKTDPEKFYATGDIGKLDDDGFLYITGRKKNIINTAYGRNISPEWIEKELEAIPKIAQCLVYGHGKPYLIALLVLRDAQSKSQELIRESLTQLNAQLPDYARVNDFILISDPFSIQNKQLTGTGRPRRAVIYQTYHDQLEQCYQ